MKEFPNPNLQRTTKRNFQFTLLDAFCAFSKWFSKCPSLRNPVWSGCIMSGIIDSYLAVEV